MTAVRPFVIRSTGGTVTAATFLIATLAVVFTTHRVEAARQSWDQGPEGSVLVGPGPYEAAPAIVDGPVDGGADGVQIDDGLGGGFGGADGCGQCGGTGCADCGPSSAFGLVACGPDHCGKACWIGRADALLLWRNAPPDRPLLDNDAVGGTFLNANGMDSTPAAGPRFSIFRVNKCTGHALEATYLRAANFRSLRPLEELDTPYVLAAPGIYGNSDLTIDSGTANLGSRIQSFELNRHHCHGRHIRFLAGFRWIEWQEQFTLQGASLGGIDDFYQTNCINDLYGGQIGIDANIWGTPWFRLDGVVKAGAYYNNAVQSSMYTTTGADPASKTVGLSPLSGAFAGEVGLTGVMPITNCLDIRFGYFGLWLSGIAQPTQQLTGQQLTPGQPEDGTINANGGVLLQGVSLGLEGRW